MTHKEPKRRNWARKVARMKERAVEERFFADMEAVERFCAEFEAKYLIKHSDMWAKRLLDFPDCPSQEWPETLE